MVNYYYEAPIVVILSKGMFELSLGMFTRRISNSAMAIRSIFEIPRVLLGHL